MTVIAGYAKRPEKKWPWILIVFILVVLFFVVLLLIPPAKKTYNKSIEKKIEIKMPEPVKSPVELAQVLENKPAISKKLEEEKVVINDDIKEIKVEKMQITSNINNSNLPVNDLDKISTLENGKVYCYTRISAQSLPQTIHHVWISPAGEKVADIKLNLSHQPADTWSYINLAGQESGVWKIEVVSEAGRVLATETISVD